MIHLGLYRKQGGGITVSTALVLLDEAFQAMAKTDLGVGGILLFV